MSKYWEIKEFINGDDSLLLTYAISEKANTVNGNVASIEVNGENYELDRADLSALYKMIGIAIDEIESLPPSQQTGEYYE